MKIVGISAYYHDSAVALLDGEELIAAAQEERFTRRKHDESFPRHALAYCLEQAGVEMHEIDRVVFYEKPLLTFERLLETYLAFAPRGFKSFCTSMPLWLSEKLYQKRNIVEALRQFDPDIDPARVLFAEHHQSHAASAFYPSPFSESIILTMDGVGEWATTTLAVGRGAEIELLKEIRFPHSLGLLYSAFTYFLGFKVNSGEYKVMGLAPYGRPRFMEIIFESLLDVKEDGSFRMDMRYFNYCTNLTMTNDRFARLFAVARRLPEAPLEQVHMDLAASVQAATEEIIFRLVRHASRELKMDTLCLAGGVALNCVANGKLLRDRLVKELWIQPAAGDAGGAVGAAYAAYHQYAKQPRTVEPGKDKMSGALLGPSFEQADIEARLRRLNACFDVLADDAELCERTASVLENERVVGWYQGRMEYGPRALGARSILADPRSPHMQRTLNLKIKRRESFRPFAPAVLAEDTAEWFDLTQPSPYMLLVGEVREHRRSIPAVTHVDHSARVQTVEGTTNPRFARLLRTFKRRSGCPMLVNTSFNVRGEPIVCTPEDAFRCFMTTDMDVLVIGDCYLEKERQLPSATEAQQFPAD